MVKISNNVAGAVCILYCIWVYVSLDMYITGLKEKTEEMVKEKINKDNLTPFDEMVQRKKEERKLKRKGQKASQKQVSF